MPEKLFVIKYGLINHEHYIRIFIGKKLFPLYICLHIDVHTDISTHIDLSIHMHSLYSYMDIHWFQLLKSF